jgi:ribonuclease P/MRP protein subunit POP1
VRRRRELAGNPAEGFSAAGDGARRLRTHLWHAKRFSMERRWGFVLPIGAHGRYASNPQFMITRSLIVDDNLT